MTSYVRRPRVDGAALAIATLAVTASAVVASNGRIHDELLAALAATRRG